jgi:hypothetical protein
MLVFRVVSSDGLRMDTNVSKGHTHSIFRAAIVKTSNLTLLNPCSFVDLEIAVPLFSTAYKPTVSLLEETEPISYRDERELTNNPASMGRVSKHAPPFPVSLNAARPNQWRLFSPRWKAICEALRHIYLPVRIPQPH